MLVIETWDKTNKSSNHDNMAGITLVNQLTLTVVQDKIVLFRYICGSSFSHFFQNNYLILDN